MGAFTSCTKACWETGAPVPLFAKNACRGVGPNTLLPPLPPTLQVMTKRPKAPGEAPGPAPPPAKRVRRPSAKVLETGAVDVAVAAQSGRVRRGATPEWKILLP